MAEKVVHEYRIIETDDGYRIEIRGDKERIKNWLLEGSLPGRKFWMGRGVGPFGGPGMMYLRGHHGPGDFTIRIEDDEEEGEGPKD